ncbi:hypothetical protein P7K49_004452, partial [Saguinus oedipus]
ITSGVKTVEMRHSAPSLAKDGTGSCLSSEARTEARCQKNQIAPRQRVKNGQCSECQEDSPPADVEEERCWQAVTHMSMVLVSLEADLVSILERDHMNSRPGHSRVTWRLTLSCPFSSDYLDFQTYDNFGDSAIAGACQRGRKKKSQQVNPAHHLGSHLLTGPENPKSKSSNSDPSQQHLYFNVAFLAWRPT